MGGGLSCQQNVFKIDHLRTFLSHLIKKEFRLKMGRRGFNTWPFMGGKKHFFFKMCPNNSLVSEKNTLLWFSFYAYQLGS